MRYPALCALALLLAAPASAVDLVSGYRSVEVDVFSTDGEVQQYEDSADLEPFDESVEIDLPPLNGNVHAIAAQTSSFSASEVVAAGGAFRPAVYGTWERPQQEITNAADRNHTGQPHTP